MNMQFCLIQELWLYKFTMSHIAMEVTKNICCAKGEGVVDYNSVTRWLKKFYFVVRALMNWPTVEANLVGSTQRI